MWIFTTFGFFSVVQKGGDSVLTIRARAAEDLDRLREKYLPELSPTKTGGGTDYPYRATVDHSAFAGALVKIVGDLHYSNFKSAVGKTMGYERESLYHEVWDVLRKIQGKAGGAARVPKIHGATGKRMAYGGVVIAGEGRVLLREPRGHYDGYVWTFPKGRPNDGETPEAAALREVQEESGVLVEIVKRIPGSFEGGTTENVYFLMRPLAETGRFDKETLAVRWATREEAQQLIQKTSNSKGRKRDLEVLKAAFALMAVS
jgi:8-oxo-dGTP pyrophosphatase MutT (NUDIX family)